MKPKSKNFIIEYHVYPFCLVVSIGESDEELFRKIKKYLPPEYHQDINRLEMKDICDAKCILFGSGLTCIRLKYVPKTPEQKGELAHEIYHAVELLFDAMNMKYVCPNEAWAYTIQYLTTEIYKRIK